MKKVVCFIASLVLVFATVAVCTRGASAEALVDSGIDYSEILDEVKTPDRGIIHTFELDPTNLQIEDMKGELDDMYNGNTWAGGENWCIPSGTALFVVKFDIHAFSSRMSGGSDAELTPTVLNNVRAALDAIREIGGTAIVRFAYDPNGECYDHDDYVKFQPEPADVQLVYRHVAQLAEVITEYKDIMTAVESGMVGPWGEQHSSAYSTDPDVFHGLVKAWLDNTPSDMKILVRYPRGFLLWYNKEYGASYTSSNIDSIDMTADANLKRLGCYNDGYLGSDDDTGTYRDRTHEVAWLSKIRNVPYGGEVLPDNSGVHNEISFVEQEAFETHTSFLNRSWDYKVISKWESQTYAGSDSVYSGKTSVYEYIRNHLGYRLVLRKAEIDESAPVGGKLQVRGKIENVGFGDVVRKQRVSLIIADEAGTIAAKTNTDIDALSFLSKTTKDYAAEITLPESLTVGKTYKAYLKIANEYEDENSVLRTVAFANNGVYDSTLGANYIGSFVAAERAAGGSAADSSTTEPNSSTAAPNSSATDGSSTTAPDSSASATDGSDKSSIKEPVGAESSNGGGGYKIALIAVSVSAGAAIAGLTAALIIFIVKNKRMKDKIKKLKHRVKTLKNNKGD